MPIETLPLVGWYPPNSILQGTVALDGPHALAFVNERNQDSVLVLAEDGKPVVALYVRAGQEYTVDGIPDGTYDIFDSRGADWNGREFITDSYQAQWNEPLEYAVDADGTGTIWTLTVGSTDDDAGESQQSEEVDENGFPDIVTEG